MKRRQVLKSGTAAGAIAVGAVSPVGARPPPGTGCTLDGRDRLAYDGDGDLIINVTRKVINGLDTGHCEPWARDDFMQHIQVWDEGADGFVAILKGNGTFDAFEGAKTPAEPCDDTLDGDESGPFSGGVRLTFDGTFAPGDSRTHGHLGTVDQGCEQTTSSCDFSSTTGWLDDYFSSWSNLSFPWWGFIYHGGKAGTWVNASTGDCGDIE